MYETYIGISSGVEYTSYYEDVFDYLESEIEFTKVNGSPFFRKLGIITIGFAPGKDFIEYIEKYYH